MEVRSVLLPLPLLIKANPLYCLTTNTACALPSILATILWIQRDLATFQRNVTFSLYLSHLVLVQDRLALSCLISSNWTKLWERGWPSIEPMRPSDITYHQHLPRKIHRTFSHSLYLGKSLQKQEWTTLSKPQSLGIRSLAWVDCWDLVVKRGERLMKKLYKVLYIDKVISIAAFARQSLFSLLHQENAVKLYFLGIVVWGVNIGIENHVELVMVWEELQVSFPPLVPRWAAFIVEVGRGLCRVRWLNNVFCFYDTLSWVYLEIQSWRWTNLCSSVLNSIEEHFQQTNQLSALNWFESSRQN